MRRIQHGAVLRGAVWAAAGATALLVAFWLEHARGMAPCALCLVERWPYRLLLGSGILWGLLGLSGRRGRTVWLVVALAVAAAIGLSVLHLGVEQNWWPSPLPECAAPRFRAGASFAERLASMPARPAKPCDAANDLVAGVPISVVDLALMYALALLAPLLILGASKAGAEAPARIAS